MSAPPAVDVSVITVTHARRELVLEKADTLRQQTLPATRFEWVVVVHEDVDGTERALRDWLRDAQGLQVRVEVKPRQRSIGAARDLAIRMAVGDVLILSDDDCLLAPDALERHVTCQARTQAVWLGPVTFRTAEREERWVPAPAWWQLNGANASLPASAVRQVGGFGDDVEGYGGEDLLLGYRLHVAGIQTRVCTEAEVVHVGPNPVAGADANKARQAGANAARIAERYPELAFRLGVHPLLMRLKRWLYDAPWTAALVRRAGGRFRYEHAYYDGAKARREARME